jgi:hypothetical protein
MDDRGALVLDVVQSGLRGDGASLGRDDAQLKPKSFGSGGYGLLGHGGAELRSAKHIHEVDGLLDLGQRSDAGDAQDFLDEGSYGDHTVPLRQQIAHDAVARPRWIRGRADQRNCVRLRQDLGRTPDASRLS